MTDNEDVLAQAREVFGTAQPVSKQTKKENLMSFRKGPVFIALRLVTPYDKAKQDYGEPFPRLTFLMNGKYVAFPMESGLLSDVADFMKQLAEVLEGVEVPRPEADVERAKALMSKYIEGTAK